MSPRFVHPAMLAFFAGAVSFTGCGGVPGGGTIATNTAGARGAGAPGDPAPQAPTPAVSATIVIPGPTKIKHIVVIVQENRSFDFMFHGFPGANTVNQGLDSHGNEIALQPRSLAEPWDLPHDHRAYKVETDGGKLDHFDLVGPQKAGPGTPTPAPHDYAYGYATPSEVAPYTTMAKRYTLADDMFESNTSDSFAAHLYLVSAQADLAVNSPPGYGWGCDAPAGTTFSQYRPDGTVDSHGPYPCFDFPTIFDLTNAKNLTWSFYAPFIVGPNMNDGKAWSTLDAFRAIRYGPQWTTNVRSPETKILRDAAKTLPSLTFVVPSYENSDHGGSNSVSGPHWVANVVNAVGRSVNWNTTAIVVLWDDWGGWYEHVPPQTVDLEGLGLRVPMIVISPYAKRGYVSHVQYDFGSVLKFVETTFNLGTLGGRDTWANDLTDCFDFSGSPAPFKPIPTTMKATDFLAQPSFQTTPPDD